jgi:oligoribonuclease
MPQAPNGAADAGALIWIDLEMTGLNPDTDRILEIATIVTDNQLNTLAEGPVLAVYQPENVLAAMDEWNQRTHKASRLIERVRASNLDEATAQRLTLEFLQPLVAKNKSPMCGNSICQDRRFLARHMPQLETWFHYRNLDVSSVKELVARWKPQLLGGLQKKNTHRALDDIRESIDELRYYRGNFFVS